MSPCTVNYCNGTSSHPIGKVIHPQRLDFSICHVPSSGHCSSLWANPLAKNVPSPFSICEPKIFAPSFKKHGPTKPRPFWWSRAVCAIIPSTWWASSARHGCSPCRWPPSWVRSICLIGESGEEWRRGEVFFLFCGFGGLKVQKVWVLNVTIGVNMQRTCRRIERRGESECESESEEKWMHANCKNVKRPGPLQKHERDVLSISYQQL